MELKPLNDLILIKRLDAEVKTPSGLIHIPEPARERPTEALVVAVGDGKPLDNGSTRAPKVKKGDKVIFGKYAGTEVKVKGEPHVLVREEEILAIVIAD